MSDLDRTNALLEQLIDEVRALHVAYVASHARADGHGDHRRRMANIVERDVTQVRLEREHRDSQSAA